MAAMPFFTPGDDPGPELRLRCCAASVLAPFAAASRRSASDASLDVPHGTTVRRAALRATAS